jgi:hypothetical protein
MAAYSIDKRVCVNAVGLSGVDRQSAGSQRSVTDHSGGRLLSLQLNPRSRLFRWQLCWFFPIHRRGTASFIDLTAHCHASVRHRIRVTKNQPIHQCLSLAISTGTTHHDVQVCTQLDVFGGQQGSLEIIGARLTDCRTISSEHCLNMGRIDIQDFLTGCDSTWVNDIAR